MGEAKRRKLLDPDYGKAKLRCPMLSVQLADFLANAGAYMLVCEYSGYEIEVFCDKERLIKLRESCISLLEKYPIKNYTVDGWNKWLEIHSAKLNIKSSVPYVELEADESFAAKKRINQFRESNGLIDAYADEILNLPLWFLNEYESVGTVGTFYECLVCYLNYGSDLEGESFVLDADDFDESLIDGFDAQSIANSGRYFIEDDINIRIIFHPELVQQYQKTNNEAIVLNVEFDPSLASNKKEVCKKDFESFIESIPNERLDSFVDQFEVWLALHQQSLDYYLLS